MCVERWVAVTVPPDYLSFHSLGYCPRQATGSAPNIQNPAAGWEPDEIEERLGKVAAPPAHQQLVAFRHWLP
jgi:hypothetical protein